MIRIQLDDSLRGEYEQLFSTCVISPGNLPVVDTIVQRILLNQSRYKSIQDALNIPWSFIAVIHQMEASGNFNAHLHNGDPLTHRTVHVPAGRPLHPEPPYTWEQSAEDALTQRGLGSLTDWSLAATLYRIEAYNGWGYRFHNMISPYLWSFSNHYTSGKYIADGQLSTTAVSKQCGAAVLLCRMAELGKISFPAQPALASAQ